MKIVGCDLHARQQTIAMVDTETGEFTEKTISHDAAASRTYFAGVGTHYWGQQREVIRRK